MRPRLLSIRSITLLGVLLWCILLPCAHAAEDFLDPDKAFQVSARTRGDKAVEVSFKVAPGYYLYREQFKFSATGASLGAPNLPHGKVNFDETFQKDVETYREVLRVAVPVERAESRFLLVVTSQGCADAGLCYPPQQSAFSVSLSGFGGESSVRKLPAGEMPAGAGSDVIGSGASPPRPRDRRYRRRRFPAYVALPGNLASGGAVEAATESPL